MKVVSMLGDETLSWRERVAILDRYSVGQVNTLSHTSGPAAPVVPTVVRVPADRIADFGHRPADRFPAPSSPRCAPEGCRCTRPSGAERARVAAEQTHPRLHIWRDPHTGPHRLGLSWQWQITAPTGARIDGGRAGSHRAALSIGLAALEHASLSAPQGNARKVA